LYSAFVYSQWCSTLAKVTNYLLSVFDIDKHILALLTFAHFKPTSKNAQTTLSHEHTGYLLPFTF